MSQHPHELGELLRTEFVPEIDTETERARIQVEYARRARQSPPDFCNLSRPANPLAERQIIRSSIRALVRQGCFPLDNRLVADIGCGTGQWLAEFLKWGAVAQNLAGIDLIETRAQSARLRIPAADIRTGDACCLPWTDHSFDLVTQFVMFTSIFDAKVKQRVASEMSRIAKPGGVILWYDFRYNNPRNPNAHGFDAKDIHSLFPGSVVHLEEVSLVPPIARLVTPASWISRLMVEEMPILKSHILAVIRKPV